MTSNDLKYKFNCLELDIYKNKWLESIVVDLNSFDHNNYKKDIYKKNLNKGKNYYGKKRRHYTDYC